MIKSRISVFFLHMYLLPPKETIESKIFSIENKHLYKTRQKSEEGYKKLLVKNLIKKTK